MRSFIQFFPIFIAILQAYYMYQIHITSSMGNLHLNLQNIGVYLISITTMYLLSLIVINASKRPVIRVMSAIIFLFLFNLQISYHFASHQLFNWAFFVDNMSIVWSLDSLYTIMYSLDLPTLLYWPVLCLFILFFDYKKKVLRGSEKKISKKHMTVLILMYLSFFMVPIRSYDPFINLFRSINFYYNNPISKAEIKPKKPIRHLYPTLNKPVIQSKQSPHIFLILVESLNGNYATILDENKQPVAPFLKQLSQNAITIDYFYGNSIQTAKGLAATLFSTYPSFRSKLFTKFHSLALDSPFSELKSLGYTSLFYLGHNNLDYDNRGRFLKKHHIDYTKTVYDDINDTDRQLSTMWGIRDDRLMMHFFNYFDQIKNKHKDTSIFSVILTSQSHIPFILPKHMRRAYQNANTIQEHYANCLANIDFGIKTFFSELEKRGLAKNSMVIITGDHAFPMGQHGITSLEAGYFEESYRMPFFLVMPDALPKQLKGPFSQVDIIPTIFDLLNHKKTNTMFIGQSIFSDNVNYPVLQIQPYEKQIGVVQLPLKYRYSQKENKEYVYHLVKDPQEKNNIILSISDHQLELFRKKVRSFYEIQKFYEESK